mmetsp:Transcript_39200/g.126796  ORF Transcript_39200/g.126796 Transcript_39200/m.126796 type:complete len:223 (+) Transcript_39200:1893-2561(+)
MRWRYAPPCACGVGTVVWTRFHRFTPTAAGRSCSSKSAAHAAADGASARSIRRACPPGLSTRSASRTKWTSAAPSLSGPWQMSRSALESAPFHGPPSASSSVVTSAARSGGRSRAWRASATPTPSRPTTSSAIAERAVCAAPPRLSSRKASASAAAVAIDSSPVAVPPPLAAPVLALLAGRPSLVVAPSTVESATRSELGGPGPTGWRAASSSPSAAARSSA